jgi:hypothetical protein
MLEQEISILKQKLREQADLAKNQTTLGGIYSVMYGFVEIIENDPLFFEFIRIKVKEEWGIEDGINKKYKAKGIDKKEWANLSHLHICGKFWHDHYSLFKTAHDFIKLDKWDISGGNTDWTIETFDLYLFIHAEQDFSKILTKDKHNMFISEFEECLVALNELINSNQKLLNDLAVKYSKTPNSTKDQSNQSELLKMTYNPNSGKSIVKYKDQETVFDGRRALILSYFYNNQEGEKTYHDFNAWLKNNKYSGFDADARMFRQEINEINGRLKKESKYLSSLIELVNNSQKDQTKANFYRFKIKPLKP